MALRPGDPFAFQFLVFNSSGALADADSLPTGKVVRNAVDDGTPVVTITHVTTGEYKATGTVPGGYAPGDILQVRINATQGGVTSGGIFSFGVLDGKRVSDLHDSAYAGGAVASVTGAVGSVTAAITLPANPPAGFLVTASYATGPGWYTSPSAPPTAAAVATAVWTDTTGGDFTVAGSPGKFLMAQLAGAMVGTTSVFSTAALANAPGGALVVDGSGRVTLAPAGLDAVVVEAGLNARQALSINSALLAGAITGQAANSPVVKGAGVTATRYTCTTDSSGDRANPVLTPPA